MFTKRHSVIPVSSVNIVSTFSFVSIVSIVNNVDIIIVVNSAQFCKSHVMYANKNCLKKNV